MPERIGFIGLGAMGAGMAANLVSAGFETEVWNRTHAKVGALVAQGASEAKNPADMAGRCRLMMLCVSDTADVEQVLFGEDGIAAGVQSGAIVIDCSTISPSATRQFSARLQASGVTLLDAPVSGGTEGAAAGTLSVMVGGPAEAMDSVLPYLQAIGATITHVGDSGAGQMVKLVNQILVVGHALAMSEALLFASAGGLDLERTLQAVQGGAAGSWMLSNRGPQIIRRDWRPGFTIDLQQKDVELALAEANRLGVPTLSTGLVHSLYRVLQRQGDGDQGNHALVRALEQLAGIQVGVG